MKQKNVTLKNIKDPKIKFKSTNSAASKKSFPTNFRPQLAYLEEKAPEGNQWLHEEKFDGYRILIFIHKKKIKFISRNGKDWTNNFATLIPEIKKLKLKESILDGEMIVLDKKGVSSFQLLQNYLSLDEKLKIKVAIFDIPFYEGYDLRKIPLLERKQVLDYIFKKARIKKSSAVINTEHILGHGSEVYKNACKHGFEGIISKNISSGYVEKRSKNWLKVKCVKKQEFVIGGYTKPRGARHFFGAILIGLYDNKKRLIYSGKVGTGFSEKTLEQLYKKFSSLETENCPFAKEPELAKMKDVTWLKPKLVAEVEFIEWTNEKRLRHPAFIGLRLDKSAKEVHPERRSDMPKKSSSLKSKNETKTKSSMKNLRIENLNITHPDKIIAGSKNVTKSELIEYYDFIADKILPYVVLRPVMIFRCPGTSEKDCFFQKHYTKGMTSNVSKIAITEKNKTDDYLMIKDRLGLITLIQLGAVELHCWGSNEKHLEKPDMITFDLDPDPKVPWKQVVKGAQIIHKALKKQGFKCFVKTSGGKGLHIVIPLKPKATWDTVKSFAQNFARQIEKEYPKLFVSTASKSKRGNKIFIDYLRNGRGATAVAAYSSRAKEDIPISTPLRWDELGKISGAREYNIHNIRKRLSAQRKDPWEGFFKVQQTL